MAVSLHCTDRIQCSDNRPRSFRSIEGNPDVMDLLSAHDVLRMTAARTRSFNASSLILSPSWKSMARLALPPRLELKRPAGSLARHP